jgi:hypothetical protein
MHKALPWIGLAAAIVVALAAAAGAYVAADYAWGQIVDYESPFADADLPPAVATPGLSDRVVMVIVDGMRDAIAGEMSAVENLRQYGADVTVVTPEPSLSYPTWTTLLSGAPHDVHGVTTNWFEGRVPVETLIDTAIAARKRTVVVGGSDSLEQLYGVERADGVYLEDWEDGDYLTGTLVDETLRLVTEHAPSFVLLYLPDLDEAGHETGPESVHYAEVADRINTDLTRLVDSLEDGRTTFVVCADHGHIDGGGHGGWEEEVTHVPAVFAGGAAALTEGEAAQEDVAPTVAALAGIPIPRDATGSVLRSVVATAGPDVLAPARAQRAASLGAYVASISGEAPSPVGFLQLDDEGMDEAVEDAVAARLTDDRRERLPLAAGILGATLLVLAAVGLASWRALAAAMAGAIGYHVVYNGIYFLIRGHRWSLSAFNEEDLIDAFFYTRMGEAVLAALVAAAIAALVYVMLRREPKPARGEYLSGWLSLGAVTVLAIQATIGWQIAWYVWWWGARVTWRIPDLMWGFKFDLDLVQTTALGAAVLLAPVVTLLVGRYHPRVRVASATTPPERDAEE